MPDATFMKRLSATLAFAVLVTGCAGGGARSRPEPALDGDLSQVLTVTIENQQLNEARVFLFIDHDRRRLGTVRGNQQETFHVPITHIAQVRLEFDLTLGEHCVTRDIPLGPGEQIDVTIPVNLNMMVAVCRRR